MTSDLRDLYQEVILDHGRRPRNTGRLEQPTCSVEGHNPLCGDRFTLHVAVQDDIVRDAAFEGTGCAISTASASLMIQAVKGMAVRDAMVLFEKFHRLITEGALDGTGLPDEPSLGKLEVLSGVHDFPTRVKCATLAWHTLRAALEKRTDTVTTE